MPDWYETSSSGQLAPIKKADLGEDSVFGLLKAIRTDTDLLAKDPLPLGKTENPVELQLTGDAPDIFAYGQNHDYLFEVKNWFPVVSQSPASWNRFGFTLRNYRNFRQDFLQKTWDAHKWRVRSVSGVHSKQTVTRRSNCIYYKMAVMSYPLYNYDTQQAMGRFFGSNIGFLMHPFVLPTESDCQPQTGRYSERTYLLGRQLEKMLKRCEDEKV